MDHSLLQIRTEVSLADHTTIGLGGVARYFVACRSIEEIREALELARRKNLRVQILGGGSNIIFADQGFDGLVLKIDLHGVTLEEGGRATAAAGEEWDSLVRLCIANGLAGIECLSGIPGTVGATPIQNVGAYGQEVADTIVCVRVLERLGGKEVTFPAAECRFGYRMSRFKSDDAGGFIVLEATFSLRPGGRPEVRYPELRRSVDSSVDLESLPAGEPALDAVRSSVLMLRRKKSMLIEHGDPNSRSVGSFFLNPLLSPESVQKVSDHWVRHGGKEPIPTFDSGDKVKIPAAWLVERAGFHRGYRRRGVGLSDNHSLALVNRGGTTRDLLDLASEIQQGVFEKFGILLEREPVVVD